MYARVKWLNCLVDWIERHPSAPAAIKTCFQSTLSIHFQRIDFAMTRLKNFTCGLCAVGFDTLEELHLHKQQAEHVGLLVVMWLFAKVC